MDTFDYLLKSNERLTQIQTNALLALAKATDYSLGAHVPKQAVLCRFKKDYRGYADKALKQIRKL